MSFTTSWSLLKLLSIELVMPSNHLILCRPLLPTIFPSIRVFSNELALRITWPKYWSFSLSPSNEYSELISFRSDWFDLRVVQGSLKSLLQHHNLKASVLQFFSSSVLRTVYVLHLYTFVHDYWKNHSFDYTDFRWQSDVITFPLRSLLISWLESPSVVIFSSVQSLSHVRLFATP